MITLNKYFSEVTAVQTPVTSPPAVNKTTPPATSRPGGYQAGWKDIKSGVEKMATQAIGNQNVQKIKAAVGAMIGKTSANRIKDLAQERTKHFEGLKNKAYKDAGGYSIGYGHKLKPGEEDLMTKNLTPQEADNMFKKDFEKAEEDTKRAAPEFLRLQKTDPNRFYAGVDMTYNLGPSGVREFKNMRAALQRKDYQTAANEIMNSKYAKQVGRRAEHNSESIRTGNLSVPEDFKRE